MADTSQTLLPSTISTNTNPPPPQPKKRSLEPDTPAAPVLTPAPLLTPNTTPTHPTTNDAILMKPPPRPNPAKRLNAAQGRPNTSMEYWEKKFQALGEPFGDEGDACKEDQEMGLGSRLHRNIASQYPGYQGVIKMPALHPVCVPNMLRSINPLCPKAKRYITAFDASLAAQARMQPQERMQYRQRVQEMDLRKRVVGNIRAKAQAQGRQALGDVTVSTLSQEQQRQAEAEMQEKKAEEKRIMEQVMSTPQGRIYVANRRLMLAMADESR